MRLLDLLTNIRGYKGHMVDALGSRDDEGRGLSAISYGEATSSL